MSSNRTHVYQQFSFSMSNMKITFQIEGVKQHASSLLQNVWGPNCFAWNANANKWEQESVPFPVTLCIIIISLNTLLISLFSVPSGIWLQIGLRRQKVLNSMHRILVCSTGPRFLFTFVAFMNFNVAKSLVRSNQHNRNKHFWSHSVRNSAAVLKSVLILYFVVPSGSEREWWKVCKIILWAKSWSFVCALRAYAKKRRHWTTMPCLPSCRCRFPWWLLPVFYSAFLMWYLLFGRVCQDLHWLKIAFKNE